MLSVRNLVVKYGPATALESVSLDVAKGELVSLIGPNGAGKSTLVNALCGVVPIASGEVSIDGRVAQVPEGRQMFPDLTVDDNLALGAWRAPKRDVDWIYELMPALLPLRRRRAGTLSGGQQQMVAIARALMAKPDLLLIDELSLGLAPVIVNDLAVHLTRMRDDGLTILLIEQEVSLALSIASRAYVLESGRIVAEGPTQGAGSQALRDRYVGGLRAQPGGNDD